MATAKRKKTEQRKNILLISFDDCIAYWHYKTIFGAELKTPNLDRICAVSTAFKSAHCQAPICGPSRASFMSGLTPHQSGVFDNKTKFYDAINPRDMWPYLIRQSGYYCSSGGKVHHGFRPMAKPLHELFYDDKQKHFRIDWKLPKNKAQVQLGGRRKGFATTDTADDGYYHDAMSANSAVTFLEEYEGDKPFYREVGFYSPHGPYITPLRYKQMYGFKSLKQPEVWKDGFHESPYIKENSSTDFNAVQRPGYWAKSVRNYFSALTHVDHHLGRVWDALKASKHADNTLVVLVSDHGFHLGERDRFRKTSLWEQVTNVPLIVHDPSDQTAREVSDPVPLIDVGPTILDYAGLPAMEHSVGQSLRPYLEGKSDADRAVPTFLYDNVGIRFGRYRLIRWVDGSTEFYDLEKDWWQTTDLGQDHPDFDRVMDKLCAVSEEYGHKIARALPPAAKAG